MGASKTYCLVCAGPSSDCEVDEEMAPGVLAALDKREGDFEWLNTYVGIPEDNIPRELGENEGYGVWTLPGSADSPAAFHPSPSYAMAVNHGNLLGGHDLYGLNCHAACYTFLHERLGYKLEFQDLWPILYRGLSTKGFHRSSEKLDSDYGGMTKYHDQFFSPENMCADGNSWMLLDPNESEQNAERLLKIWTPIVEAFKEAALQAQRKKLRPMLIALYCSFQKACQLAEKPDMLMENIQLWTAMSAMPSGLVYNIAVKAGLVV